MAYEQKDNTGSLFRNERKEADTHPDYKGSALLNGVEHWLDAWLNESKDGKKYMSLKFKPKEARPQPARDYPNYGNQTGGGAGGYKPDLDDEVPFIRAEGID